MSFENTLYTMAVPPSLLPSHSKKVLGAMRAERTVKRITFNPTSANPGKPCTSACPSLQLTRLSSRARLPSCSISTSKSPALTPTTIWFKMCREPWWTSSTSSLPPQQSRKQLGTTSTSSSRTSFYQRMSVKTC